MRPRIVCGARREMVRLVDWVGVRAVDEIRDVTQLAQGGYNSIWLVKLRAQLEVKYNLYQFCPRQAIAASRREGLNEHCNFSAYSFEVFESRSR
jgi:hypothetical protein